MEETQPAKQAGPAQCQTRGPRERRVSEEGVIAGIWVFTWELEDGAVRTRVGGHRERLRGAQQADRVGCGRVSALRAGQDEDGRVGWGGRGEFKAK